MSAAKEGMLKEEVGVRAMEKARRTSKALVCELQKGSCDWGKLCASSHGWSFGGFLARRQRARMFRPPRQRISH